MNVSIYSTRFMICKQITWFVFYYYNDFFILHQYYDVTYDVRYIGGSKNVVRKYNIK